MGPYATAVIASTIAILLRWLLDPVLGEAAVFITVFPAVAISVWRGGARAGIVAAVISGVAALYLFLPPKYSFALANLQAVLTLIAYLISSAVVIAIGHHLQRSTERSRNAEHLLQSIMDGLPALVSLTDRNLRYCLVNEEYSRWFGVREHELLGKSLEEVLGNEAFAKVKPRIEKALAGETVTFRDYLPYAHGGAKWVQVTYRPHKNSIGQIDGVIVLVQNISEQARAEESVAEREREFRAMFELNATGSAVVDVSTGKFTMVNEKFCELTGFSSDELLNKSFSDLTHADDQARDREVYRAALQSRAKNWDTEKRYVRKDGSIRWVAVRGTIIRDAKGMAERTLATIMDMTEWKKAQELLQSQAQHLEELVKARTERLQEVILELESFSYTIAHDLRGPLRAMSGFADALKEDYGPDLDETARDYIRRITSAAERMDRLICDVLDYSKITRHSFEPEQVPLDPLIDGIMESYPAISNGSAVVEVGRPLPAVMGTQSLLVQCFSNLIGNAVKFVPEGKTPEVNIWAEARENGRVRIWVEDNGIGIARQNHERIFGLFQRLNKDFEGTGIGLAIVCRSVERMGGLVGLESIEGQGSKFWVELNAADKTNRREPVGSLASSTNV